jgi:hypothetical protein
MLSLCFSVFVSHWHKTKPKGWDYWLVFRRVVCDPLDPFSLNGFTGSCRVTRENSRVYPLDPFIKRVVSGSMLNGSRVIRVVNGSCRVTRFASPKSRHIGLRHNYVRQLLTDRVITIDFVRSVQNLADPLTKGFARDLVWKTSKGVGLKPLDHQ